MSAVYLILFFYIIPIYTSKIFLQIPDQNENLHKCLSDLIKTYFYQFKELTYVDMNSDNQEIIKTIHSMTYLAVISRKAKIRLTVPAQSYLITTGNTSDFSNHFQDLVKEASWNPSTRFLILIGTLLKDDLKTIFDVLLKFHIINVVVINKFDSNLYTYNPFKNYRCGSHYDKILELGKCSTSHTTNLYPHKLVTGLKNCTFRVASPHWPPYVMDPARNNDVKFVGIEQYILNQIGVLEHFTLNFTYGDDAEVYTMITQDMSAVGPLYSLQKGEADVILGGMILTHPRAKAFNYIYGHLAFVDDIRYQVKKATAVSSWKNLYLEFSTVVWITLLFSFIMYFLIFIVLVRPKDKGQIFINMLAYMFLISIKIRGNSFTKYLFVTWVWFVYLVNSYYQSSLVSLTTNPSMNYQISNEMDIIKYNLKPCESKGIRDYLLSVEDYSFQKNQFKGCGKMLESIHTVSRSNDKFAVTLYTLYTYNKHSFYDKTGDSMIYTFSRPLSKTIYAIYVYKGFPMLEKLYIHTLRLRENGLIDYYLKNLYWQNNEKYRFIAYVRKSNIDIPWYVLIYGYSMSVVIYILEFLIKRHFDRLNNMLPLIQQI